MEWISCFHLIQPSHIQPSEAISSGGLLCFIHIIDKYVLEKTPPKKTPKLLRFFSKCDSNTLKGYFQKSLPKPEIIANPKP
jgi:hypothetical protein